MPFLLCGGSKDVNFVQILFKLTMSWFICLNVWEKKILQKPSGVLMLPLRIRSCRTWCFKLRHRGRLQKRKSRLSLAWRKKEFRKSTCWKEGEINNLDKGRLLHCGTNNNVTRLSGRLHKAGKSIYTIKSRLLFSFIIRCSDNVGSQPTKCCLLPCSVSRAWNKLACLHSHWTSAL